MCYSQSTSEPALLSQKSPDAPLCFTLRTETPLSSPTPEPNIRLINPHETIQEQVEKCGHRTVMIPDKRQPGKFVPGCWRCHRPRYCNPCLNSLVDTYIATLQEALILEPDQPLYILDFELNNEASMEKMKRNIRLKKPAVLIYLPHDLGTTLLTTEGRYGGKQTTLGQIERDVWYIWVLSRPGKRARIMIYNKVLNLEPQDQEEVTVKLNTFVTDAPIKAVAYVNEIADAIVENSQEDLPLQEKMQAKLDVAADILKKKYVVQRLYKTYKIKIKSRSNTTSIGKFNLLDMQQKCHENSQMRR